MVPKSGSFQEEFFLLSGQKKSQKLDRALPWLEHGPQKKVQVANAIAKCHFFVWRCEPNAAQPNAAVATACQNDDRITYCGGPWIWGWQNCTSRAQKLEPHLLVKVHSASAPWLNHCRSQCNIRLAWIWHCNVRMATRRRGKAEVEQ